METVNAPAEEELEALGFHDRHLVINGDGAKVAGKAQAGFEAIGQGGDKLLGKKPLLELLRTEEAIPDLLDGGRKFNAKAAFLVNPKHRYGAVKGQWG